MQEPRLAILHYCKLRVATKLSTSGQARVSEDRTTPYPSGPLMLTIISIGRLVVPLCMSRKTQGVARILMIDRALGRSILVLDIVVFTSAWAQIIASALESNIYICNSQCASSAQRCHLPPVKQA